MAKKSKKLNLGFLKSKKVWLLIAVIVAAIVGLAYYSEAGSKTQGRVFSWKDGKNVRTEGGKVLYNYRIFTRKPNQGFQYVQYKFDRGQYYGIYTEKSNPSYGSRDLKPGDKGEDVKILQSAIKAFGEGYVNDKINPSDTIEQARHDDPVQIKTKYSGIRNIEINGTFDQKTVSAVNNLCQSETVCVKEDGDYLSDNILNKYDLARALNKVTYTRILKNQGVVFDYKKGAIIWSGEVAESETRKLDYNKWDFNASTWRGQSFSGNKAIKSSSDEGSFTRATVWTQKTNPNFGSRTLKPGDKGEDVKVLQSMLRCVWKKFKGDFGGGTDRKFNFSKIKVNGKYDEETKRAVKRYQELKKIPASGFFGRDDFAALINDLVAPVFL